MKITDKGQYREIQAAKGKFLKKGDSYFTKGIMLPDETDADYTEVDSIPEVDNNYGERVESLIRAKYSLSDEIAILRQKDAKPEEFEEYYSFVEECKHKAKTI